MLFYIFYSEYFRIEVVTDNTVTVRILFLTQKLVTKQSVDTGARWKIVHDYNKNTLRW